MMTGRLHDDGMVRIAPAAKTLWTRYRHMLEPRGVSLREVQQQAWVAYLQLHHAQRPTSYTYERLVDWLRLLTQYNFQKKKIRTFVEFHERIHAGSITMDVETPEICEKVRQVALKRGSRSAYIFDQYLEGYSMKAIGRHMHITEGRVCQIYGGILKQARRALLMVALVGLCFGGTAWAQPVEYPKGCLDLEWIANAEPDLAGYRIYVDENGQPQPVVIVGNDMITKACNELSFNEGNIYSVALTAFDTSGNESPPSLPVEFSWPDTTPPATPTGLTITITIELP